MSFRKPATQILLLIFSVAYFFHSSQASAAISTKRCLELFPEKVGQSSSLLFFGQIPRRICLMSDDSQKESGKIYVEFINYSVNDETHSVQLESILAFAKLQVSKVDLTAIRPYFKTSIEKFGLNFDPGDWNESLKKTHALSALGTEITVIKNDNGSSLVKNGTVLIGEDRYFFLEQPVDKLTEPPCWTQLY